MFYLISSPVVSHVISSLINLLNREDIKRTEKTLKRWVYLAIKLSFVLVTLHPFYYHETELMNEVKSHIRYLHYRMHHK